jgi:hypothetical protein
MYVYGAIIEWRAKLSQPINKILFQFGSTLYMSMFVRVACIRVYIKHPHRLSAPTKLTFEKELQRLVMRVGTFSEIDNLTTTET